MGDGAEVVLRLEEEGGQVATLVSEVNSQTRWWERKLGGKALPWAGSVEKPGSLWATHMWGVERGGRCTIGNLCSTEGLWAGRVNGADSAGPTLGLGLEEGHRSLVPTNVPACAGAGPMAESKGWEGRRPDVSAGPLRAPVWLSASHSTWRGPARHICKREGQRCCPPRCLCTAVFCESVTSSYFRAHQPGTKRLGRRRNSSLSVNTATPLGCSYFSLGVCAALRAAAWAHAACG